MKRGLLYIAVLVCVLFEYQLYPNSQGSIKSEYPSNKGNLAYHPVHISFTNVEFNSSTKKFEILFKLYVDDFTTILNKKYGKHLNFTIAKSVNENQEIINKYILEHFKLIINGKDRTKSDLAFLKMDIKEQSIWLYYDLNFKGNYNTFGILNSLMTDLYQDQTNLLIFTFNDEQKAVKFSLSKTMEKLTF